MTNRSALKSIDPIHASDLDEMSSSPVFDDLLRDILEGSRSESDVLSDPSVTVLPRNRRRRVIAVLAVAAAVVLLAVLLVEGGGGSPSPVSKASTAARHGTWRLADDVLSGTWQQYTSGPAPGTLSCPTTSQCYAMSGQYASTKAGSPLLAEHLYVSTDAGAVWTMRDMPQGFAPTTVIACGAASTCAAGGTQGDQSVLVSTHDGGRSWITTPLPTGVGHLDTLSCPTADFCAGLAADSEFLQLGATNATFLATRNGGKSFSDHEILSDDSMEALDCVSTTQCTAIGWSNTLGPNDITAGVSARTTDGGKTWTAGILPTGLGVNSNSQVACGDASHCWLTGNIEIPYQDPPQCAELNPPLQGSSSATVPPGPQSPAVRALAESESQALSAQIAKNGTNRKSFSCGSPGRPIDIGALASSNDGGLTWTPNTLPDNVPEPMFSDLSCPTNQRCWATGSDAVPQQVGSAYNGGSPMLLGTNDGGSTWSNVTFNVPSSAPNYLGQGYLSMGSISCPSNGLCVALGTGAQSAPSAPTYSLVVPSLYG